MSPKLQIPRGLIKLVLALALLPSPDTLQAARVTAQHSISEPTESLSGESLRSKENLADAVRAFSGLQLKDYGGAGGLKTVNVRSLGSAHTAIFLDGLPIENAQNMQVDLGRLFTDGLEKAELYTGQRSLLLQSAREYGSASALHLTSAVPEGRRVRIHLHGGAFGTVAPRLAWESRRGSLGARIQAAYQTAHGRYPFHITDYRNTPEGYLGYDTLMIRQNCDITAFRAQAQLFWRPRGGCWQASASWYDASRGIPGPVYKQADDYPLSSDRQSDANLSLQVGGTQRLSPRWQVLFRGKYALDKLSYLDISELDPSVSAQWDYRQQGAYLSTALGWQATERLHFSAALDGQADILDAGRLHATRQILFGAISAALMLDPWRVSAAVQYQLSSDGYRFLSPSLLLNWHPREDWDFGWVLKRSCRLPSFNDLYYSVVTRELRPESVWQTAARWCWERSYGPWHFRLREELYFNLVQDKLIAVPNGSLFRWSMYNIGMVRIFGDELSAGIVYRNAGKEDWEAGLTARYTYQWAQDPSSGYQIPYIPLHSASFQLYGCWRGLRLDVTGFLTGERWTAASARPENRLAPWTSWDTELSYQPGRAIRRVPEALRIGVELRNLFNEQYQIVRQYPMPGLHALLKLDYSF